MIQFLIAILLLWQPTPDKKAPSWSKEELAFANTAKKVKYMTDDEKTVIQYMNLARLYPQKYLKIGISDNSINKQKSKYHRSLIKMLNEMEPVTALQPSESMYQLAQCLAKEQSKSGKIGHARKKCDDDYWAECCSYGWDGPEIHVLQLLIDEDVPSLGHREIILDQSYSVVGAAIQPHKNYGKCTVIDFN